MIKLQKLIYIIIGLLAFILGFIGAILPVLPTTPFLLLASFCFVRGSEKFDKWFKSSKIYIKYLKDFTENKSMTLKQKIYLLIFSDIMIAFPLIILDSIYIKLLLILVVIFKYYFFIFEIKTINIHRRNSWDIH